MGGESKTMKKYKIQTKYQIGFVGGLILYMTVCIFFIVYFYNRYGDLAFILVFTGGFSGFIVIFSLIVFIFDFIKESLRKEIEREYRLKEIEQLDKDVKKLKNDG